MKRTLFAVAATTGLAMSASAVSAPLDLSGFTAFSAGSANWSVAGDNLSVTQTVNGNPTAFVSADSFINSSFDGRFEVRTTSDDDYIGFVFGFGADASDPFFLFDWKQQDQSGSTNGFTLARVTGGLSAIPFGNHQTDATGYDVIAFDVGTNSNREKGWQDNTLYDFRLTYQSNRILIEVGGNAPLGPTLETIFDISPADVAGVSSFTEGRFGFFNHSQSNVRYEGFTEAAAPVPLPAALPLLLTGIAGLGLLRLRRRQAA